jgi:hypothetical protein
LKGIFNEGSKEKVQQNGSTPLIESPKLDQRPLDEDPNPIQANLSWHLHGVILEGNSIDMDQKMQLKKSSWFGKPRCKLGSKVIYLMVFIVFHYFIFSLVFKVEIVHEWKTFFELKILSRAHPPLHFCGHLV